MIPPSVQPWARCDPRRLRGVRGVLTDIDDTLTTEGAIPMGVVAALAALRDAGLPVIADHRPADGLEPAVRRATCRSAAVVAENGAVALIPRRRRRVRDRIRRQASRCASANARAPAPRRPRASSREVPGATLARDSAGRVTDIAIDHAEFAHLDAARDRRRWSR